MDSASEIKTCLIDLYAVAGH